MHVLLSIGACVPYALDCAPILEILPFLPLIQKPNSSLQNEGFLVFDGIDIPVFDLSKLLGGIGSQEWLSTRIVIYQTYTKRDSKAESRGVFGLIVEKATAVEDWSKLEKKNYKLLTINELNHLIEEYSSQASRV